MSLRELLGSALEALRTHALRSMLTALGIVFGVAAVIAMLSIGEGARRQALEQIERLGVRNILILDDPVEPTPSEEAEEDSPASRSPGLEREDAVALATVHPLLDLVVPQREQEAVARVGAEAVDVLLVGTTVDWARVREVEVSGGRFLDAYDLSTASTVCVLGEGVRRQLFPFGGAVGSRVKIADDWLTVVGTFPHRLTTGADGSTENDPDFEVVVPLSALLARGVHDADGSELSRITARVSDPTRVNEAAALVKRVLERRHRGVQDTRIVVPEALLRQQQKTQRIFNVVMGTIASISLLVGGIGIMNIMLAAVLERTREIGVRRAVGAKRRDVLGQFLTEAVLVSVIGGLIGIALGLALTSVIAKSAGWPVAVSIPSIFLSFGVAAAVGIVFGYFPARRAAQLDPIDCLRYE